MSYPTSWLPCTIALIEADYHRSADTHLIPPPLPAYAAHGVGLYLKDESTLPTGSLKHRRARSLFLYALCNGWVQEGSTIVETSSGSTAVSEAYFARLLGLPFVAVMPRGTSAEKIALIEFHGGRCHFVDGADEVYGAAQHIAHKASGHCMDQFTASTNLVAMLRIAREMRKARRQGSVLSLLCDAGKRRLPSTCCAGAWARKRMGCCCGAATQGRTNALLA